MHYVVTEVLFTLILNDWGEVNWRAFVEVETGAVLYLRAAVAAACCSARIYRTDPNTTSGDIRIRPNSPTSTLNLYRTTVSLERLKEYDTATSPLRVIPINPRRLNGEYVRIADTDDPTVPPPTSPISPCKFEDSVPSDTFAAVNAYYHLDSLYGLMEEMGFTVSEYFSNTTFPVSADHRGLEGVQATASGNEKLTALSRYQFGKIQAGTEVSIAVDGRMVAHEFGHHCLYDRIRYPYFRFAHSCGDSIAVILNDPYSHLAGSDRFLSFPFIPSLSDPRMERYYRRHDRPVADGWGWGGAYDTGEGLFYEEEELDYFREQILSTTLFRIYRSIGGDAAAGSDIFGRFVTLVTKQHAARYMLYLIFRAIASLGPSPITPTSTPNPFANALMDADTGSSIFERRPGGGIQKVIRWGFEKQGLYRAPGAALTSEGAPTPVDVYIDDGRHGEYQYQKVFWNNTDIWNRNIRDGGETHETPIVGLPNYAYVWVKNRGTQKATNVVVRGFHARPSTSLVWPDDWVSMDTAEIWPGNIEAGATIKVGPFEWIPRVAGHECLFMYVRSSEDRCNADPATRLPCATGPTPPSYLVPFDNNIAQRNVAPVAATVTGLVRSFKNRRFWAINPFGSTASIVLEPVLPDFLRQRQWEIRFLNPGGAKFTLGPRARRKVILSMKQGGDFSPDDVKAAGEKATIEIHALIDGEVTGGMTYVIDSNLSSPPPEYPEDGQKQDLKNVARELLDRLNLPSKTLKDVTIRPVTLDLDLEEEH
jgi:hypothetical protein